MSDRLALSLLGPPQLQLNDQPLSQITSRKAKALLIYLAMNRGEHTREALANLLWSEIADTQSRNNLRIVLHGLRQLHNSYLAVTRGTVAFNHEANYWLDFEILWAQLAHHQFGRNLTKLPELVALYRGEFLEGFHVRNASAFEEWMLQQREFIRTRLIDAMGAAIQETLAQGDYTTGLKIGNRLLTLEPWLESAHRQRMQLLARSGRRSDALAQYHTCQQALATELGVEPAPQTQQLRDSIRNGEEPWQTRAPDQLTSLQQQDAGATVTPNHSTDALAAEPHVGVSDSEGAYLSFGLDAPLVDHFYGRQQELSTLRQWIVQQRCRVVAILGMGGQGKTALAATFVHTLNIDEFDIVIWRSLLNAPPLTEIMQTWLPALARPTALTLPTSLDQQFDLLLAYLRQRRCLLVLDNVESILRSGTHNEHYRADHEEYAQLLSHIGQQSHRSTLLMTSRERPPHMAQLMQTSEDAQVLVLDGLPLTTGYELLAGYRLRGLQKAQQHLIERYSGNPLALILAASNVAELYGGDLQSFLDEKTIIFDDIEDVLVQQFARLATAAQQVLFWLAVEREPITIATLCSDLFQARDQEVRKAVAALQHRFLIVRQPAGFTLQNVVLEYLTDRLVATVIHELTAELRPQNAAGTQPALRKQLRTSHFNQYPLLKAQSKAYVRQSQMRLLLQPVAAGVIAYWGQDGAVAQLAKLLDALHTAAEHLPGYAAANLLHLLLELDADLRHFDFSHLALWQAHLQRAHLPHVDLTQSDLTGSLFLESLGRITALTLSQDGEILAVGSSQGDVTLWRMSNRQLITQRHVYTLSITSLSFSADGRRLAIAGNDPTIVVWGLLKRDSGFLQITKVCEIAAEAPYLGGHVAFHPDGNQLASSGADGGIHIWDVATGELLHELSGYTHMAHALAFSPDGTILATGGISHLSETLHLWQVTEEQYIQAAALLEHSSALALAFSPDGRFLITAQAGEARIWDVATARLQALLEDGVSAVFSVAVSADGTMVASGHHDGTVRIWDVQRRELLHILSGHTDHTWGLAFSLGDQFLVSGAVDRVVRLWDAQTGQLVYTFTGHSKAIHALALSADAQLLVSGGADGFVRLWRCSAQDGYRQSGLLRGHIDRVLTVAFHPTRPLLATAGDDRMIRVWEIGRGQESSSPVQMLHGHDAAISSVAFHPDGQFLVSCSFDYTIRLWDLVSGQLVQTLRDHTRIVYSVAFSPDGQLLMSADSGNNIFVWQWQALGNGTEPLQRMKQTEHPGGSLTGGIFIPHGTFCAASVGAEIHLYDDDWSVGAVLEGHTSTYVWGLCSSSDGRLLISSGEDLTVRVWSLTDQCQVAQLEGHEDAVVVVDISADGTLIGSGSWDGTIRIWETATGACLQTLRPELPYEGMTIKDVIGLTDAQRASLKALGATESSSSGVNGQLSDPARTASRSNARVQRVHP